MTPRYRLALFVGAIALSGCGGAGGIGPLHYNPSENLTTDLKDKPNVQARVEELIGQTFGATTDMIRVPPGAPIPQGGARLASSVYLGKIDEKAPPQPVVHNLSPDPGEPDYERIRGGYTIYRNQCMHCHGASGDGNGPTAPFLWPHPRDYRLGVFKFTSTSGSGPDSKPTRADLRRTLHEGIPGTSMPAFKTLLTDREIEQVIDYVMFLSIRGESERNLIYLAMDVEDKNAQEELTEEQVEMATMLVFQRWQAAEDNVINPKVPRSPATPESIARGRQLFLGEKGLQCFGCHGLNAKGNGESFVSYDLFKHAVFDGNPDPAKVEALKKAADEAQKKWGDDWGDPLRPADLTRGVYKGGRRPIDIFWRIAKGINGTPMPAHLGSQLQTDQEVWDLVNFVLTLPYEPDLLKGAQPVAGASAIVAGAEPDANPAPASSAPTAMPAASVTQTRSPHDRPPGG